jgi:hypothetical protein
MNHPPKRDFVKHLRYDRNRSSLLDYSVQAYSNLKIDQDGILFGYAFYSDATSDFYNTSLPPYKHPQSFYFSGDPDFAPMVTQNFMNFRAERPRNQVWQEVIEKCPPQPEWCCLFDSDCNVPKGQSPDNSNDVFPHKPSRHDANCTVNPMSQVHRFPKRAWKKSPKPVHTTKASKEDL